MEDAFHTRELLKVKVLDTAPRAARELGTELTARLTDAHLMQVIGHTLVK